MTSKNQVPGFPYMIETLSATVLVGRDEWKIEVDRGSRSIMPSTRAWLNCSLENRSAWPQEIARMAQHLEAAFCKFSLGEDAPLVPGITGPIEEGLDRNGQ